MAPEYLPGPPELDLGQDGPPDLHQLVKVAAELVADLTIAEDPDQVNRVDAFLNTVDRLEGGPADGRG